MYSQASKSSAFSPLSRYIANPSVAFLTKHPPPKGFQRFSHRSTIVIPPFHRSSRYPPGTLPVLSCLSEAILKHDSTSVVSQFANHDPSGLTQYSHAINIPAVSIPQISKSATSLYFPAYHKSLSCCKHLNQHFGMFRLFFVQ